MKFQRRSLLGLTTCLALFFGVATTVIPVAAQETTSHEPPNGVSSDLDDHDRGPRNGDLAISATTVVDGAYGPAEIATVPKDGGPYHFLTTLPGGGVQPDFDRDGDKIFFQGPGPNGIDGIYTVPTRGGRTTQLQTNCITDSNCLGEGSPVVSPDGRQLLEGRAYGPSDQNGCLAFGGVYLLRIDGSHPRQASPTEPPCVSDFNPRWSPDGRWFTYLHQDLTGLFSVWVIRLGDSSGRQISPVGMDSGGPDWSPNGDRIVFQSPAEPADDQHPQQIYTIRPDGTHLRQITHYVIIPGFTIGTFGARWSPDGRKLVFAHRDPNTTLGPDGQPHSDIFEMNSDGTDVVQITFTPEKDNDPAWGARR